MRFKRNPLEKISDCIDKKIQKVVGPPSETNKFGATSEEWIDYRKRSAGRCPRLYKIKTIIDDIDTFLSVRKRKYWDDPIWFLKNTFKYKTWKVEPKGLKVGRWYEADERIINTMMQILVEYIENQCGGKPWELESIENGESQDIPENEIQTAKDLWEIYIWWTKEREIELKAIEDIYDEIPDIEGNSEIMFHFTKERMEETRPYHKRIRDKEKILHDKEVEYLKKIIDLKGCMWV